MIDAEPFRLAAAQYEIGFLQNWVEYENKADRWVAQAVGTGAQFLLFPEYFSMELASLFPEEVNHSLPAQLAAMQDLYLGFLSLYEKLARRYKVCIVAGSYPVRQPDGSYRNRSWLFSPDRNSVFQDKLQMTRFENEVWNISGGDALKVFDTAYGKVGINICYDAEFPLLARQQIRDGANFIVVPSCTDKLSGYNRVRVGCLARALENQCYVAQSPTVGQAPWSSAVDINIGAAGVFTPMDNGLPHDGVLAIGEMNKPQWVYADIDLAAMARVRQNGQVLNHRDWDGQMRYVKP